MVHPVITDQERQELAKEMGEWARDMNVVSQFNISLDFNLSVQRLGPEKLNRIRELLDIGLKAKYPWHHR